MKKAIAKNYLAGLILLAVAAIIILAFVPQVSKVLLGAGSKSQCQYSMLVSQALGIVTFGLGDVPPECKAERITVTKKSLNDIIKKNKVEKILKEYADSSIKEEKDLSYSYPVDDSNSKYRWAFTKTIADALNDCRQKVLADLKLKEGELFTRQKPMCIVCYLIRIDPAMYKILNNHDSLTALLDWLKVSYPKNSKKSYYELLSDAMEFSGLGDKEVQKENTDLELSGWKLKKILEDPSDAIAITYAVYPTGLADDPRLITMLPYKKITSIGIFPMDRYLTFLKIIKVTKNPKCELIIA